MSSSSSVESAVLWSSVQCRSVYEEGVVGLLPTIDSRPSKESGAESVCGQRKK